MSSYVRITTGRPLSVFDKSGRLLSSTGLEIIIPFDDDGAWDARQEVLVQAIGGLPPGFAHIATHIVQGELVTDDDLDLQQRDIPG